MALTHSHPEMQTTDDAFLGGALSVCQPRSGYRAGIDAILLAAAVPACQSPVQVLDIGTGVGTVALAIAWRLPSAQVIGFDKQADLIALAQHNVVRNGMTDRISMVVADLTAPAAEMAEHGLEANSFDHLVANPPYFEEGRIRAPASTNKQQSHAMRAGDLEQWVKLCAHLGTANAMVTLIHRPDALGELIAAMTPRFGDMTITPIYPAIGREANRIIIQARKGSRAPLRIRPGLILHNEDGTFAPGIRDILRNGAALPLHG